jgi:type I restriction enzyme S subunit
MVNGWIEKPLGEVAEIKTGPFGSSLHAEDYGTIGTPIITVEHLGEYTITRQNLPLVSLADKLRLSAYILDAGDIVFSRVGSVDRNAYVTTCEDGWLFSGRLLRIRLFKNGDIDSKYLSYYFKYEPTRVRVREIAVGQTMASLNTKLLNNFSIVIPPLLEQRHIAETLSDMDNLIAAMEKLIAKKRAIKQGTMQELLTGKRRLPGFEGKWVERAVDYYGTFTSGNGFPLAHQGGKAGDYPFYKVSDFSNVGNEYVMCRANNYISSAVASTLNCNIIPDDSIVFAKIGAAIFLERKRQNKGDCCIDNNMMAFTVNSEGSSQYIMYLFQTIKFGDIVTATALPSLSGKQVGAITKLFPPTIAEQAAIAEILSDMDAEIDALTVKLNKLRNIKQGMMSELLTGHIRLTEQETEAAIEAVTRPKIIELPKREPQIAVAQMGGHNRQFDDAVMIAGIVDAIYSEKFPLGRKKVQKCLYLLRRHQDESTAAFKKKAAGPYADEVRYKGGEPIARSAKYITTKTTKGKGTTFARGTEIGKALGYIQRWGKQADIQWVADNLKYKRVDELELLATVDMAICDLTEAGTPVSVASIKRLIASNKEWKAKLKKQIFSDANIARAIRELQTLL